MARILCVTNGLAGLLYSSLELARRLETAGHDITFASVPDAGSTIRSRGIRFVPIDVDGYDRFLASDATRGTLTRLLSVRDRRRRAAQAMGADSFVALLRDLGPDLVLVDAEMHAHIMAASAAGYRTALLVTFVSIWRRPGLPPPHHLVRPGAGWRGTALAIGLMWLNLRVRKRRVAITQWFGRIGCDRVSVLRQVASDVGFDFDRLVDSSQWLIPFTYREVPALCTHAMEFEFPHEPPAHVRYLGPLILEDRQDSRVDASTRTQLDRILERRRSGGPERRLIYAGFGSFFTTDAALVRRLLEAVASRSDWDLVLSLGGRLPARDIGPIPANACLLRWVPQLEVLRHADVAVIHGGINTVDECVLAGVPMLVYCGFETDMGGTTARVAHHGIGIVGDARHDSPGVIGDRIGQLLGDPRFRQNIGHLRAPYVAYRTNHVAERVVAALLGRTPGAADGSPVRRADERQ
jgi:zeaxanthin glucosyltransferase